MDLVSVEACEQYDAERIAAIVEKQFCIFEEKGQLFRDNAVVLIKPNLLMGRKPEAFTTVHPALIGGIIRAVKKRNGRPVIAESPAGPFNRFMLKNIYAVTGMTAVAEKEGAELSFDTECVTVPAKGTGTESTFHLISAAVKADAVISASKLKTHSQMVYTGVVKNLFGTVPGLEKPELHSRFPEKERFASMIVDLCETVHPVLSFLDGITGMEGNGPSGGTPAELGLLFAGTNPYAVDAAACRKIGLPPEKVPVLSEAAKRGLFHNQENGITLTGSGAESAGKKFRLPDSSPVDFSESFPAFFRPFITAVFTPHPVIRRNICIGCGKCAESCPRHTIRIKNKKAEIERSGCIRCFCCQEVCPKKAVKIAGFLPQRNR